MNEREPVARNTRCSNPLCRAHAVIRAGRWLLCLDCHGVLAPFITTRGAYAAPVTR